MLCKIILAAMLAAMILFVIPPTVAQPAATSPLVGAWEFTLDPATKVPPDPIIPGLITFNAEGNAIASVGGVSAGEEQSTTEVSVAQGIWQLSPAAGHFFVRLISFSTNPNGSFHAKRTFTMTIALNAAHDEFTGGYSYDVEDATGHVLTTGTGTVKGTLIPHPLLP